MLPFSRVTIIGLGLIGSSLARAIREAMPTVRVTGHDADAGVREIARVIDLCDDVTDTAGASVTDADLVVLCVPVRAMGAAAAEIADDLPAEAIISDVGSCKADVLAQLNIALPGRTVIPAHPVAGTENSGPEAGFASLFRGRWCIVTPPADADPAAVERVSELWRRVGADVETMDPAHHDLVLAVTSHLPHLIAYTIVGTASDLEDVTQSEVIKYSAGASATSPASPRPIRPCGATCSWRTRMRCWRCSSAFRRICRPCSGRSAGMTGMRCSTCSPARGRSGGRSSNRGRTIPSPTSGVHIE